jgi:cell division protein ZapE
MFTGKCCKSGSLTVNNRQISYQAKHHNVIYFDFYALCAGPRSQRDYINLADNFQIVFLDKVPQFSGNKINIVAAGVEDGYQRKGNMLDQLRHLDDEARRFIALVDEFYDRKVRLIINAEVDIIELYQGEQLSFEFARCQSRLIEMQSITISQ